MTLKNSFLPACTLTLLLPFSALADITYVDAVEGPDGNTFATGGTLTDTSWIDLTTNSPSMNDTSWMKRFGGTPGWSEHNGGDVIQAQVSSFPNDLPELTTEITGLSDGQYEVWAFFWEQTVSDTQNWMIDAALISGEQSSYSSAAGPVAGTDSASPVDANTLTFSNAPSVTGAGGNQTMYGVNLGQVSVANGAPIRVYLDKILGTGSRNRTIYDGVGYQLIHPAGQDLAVTSFTELGEGLWELEFQGRNDTAHLLRSSPSLALDSGVVVEDLSQEIPGEGGSVGGEQNQLITTDSTGRAKIQLTLPEDSAQFIRVEIAP